MPEPQESGGILTIYSQITSTLNALVETAALINISPGHRAAACNPLCSIIERCQISQDERIRNLVWTAGIWPRLFVVFLDRSHLAKPKSVRQILLLLTSVLEKCNAFKPGIEARGQALETILQALFEEGDHLRVKPALQALAHFIQKELFQVSEILNECKRWHSAESSGSNNAAQSFLVGVMGWVSYPDTAPAAGNLVSTFLKFGRIQNVEAITSKNPSRPLAVWVEPLESSVRQNPDAIQNFRSHLFPELFRPVLSDYLEFLVHLRIDDHVGLRLNTTSCASQTDDLQALLLFTALQTGKEMGIVKEIENGQSQNIEISEGAIGIPAFFLEDLLSHERPETRLAALSILINSAAITRPFTRGTLAAFERNFGHLHADTDANFRGEVTSLTLQLFDRLRAATSTLSKALARSFKANDHIANDSNNDPTVAKQELLDAHIGFIKWYLRFLEHELRPTAAYQRHISALKSLTIITKSGLDANVPRKSLSKQAQGEIKWPFRLTILVPSLVRALFDLIMDPFDDVRHTAASLLKLGSAPGLSSKTEVAVEPASHGHGDPDVLVSRSFANFQARAEKTMLRSGRADHSDGVARAYDLIFEKRASGPRKSSQDPEESSLEWSTTQKGVVEHLMQMLDTTIAMASQDLSAAVSGYPMHGLLAGLRYIFDEADFYSSMAIMDQKEVDLWKSIHRRLFMSLRSIWTCVQGILCNDAPEGHVPDDMEEEPDLTTKDILSYSWRALKEASTLIRVVVAKAPFNLPDGTVVLETSEFEELGRLCFLQLAELRHRGAFSTVAQTFAACCLRSSRSSDPAIRQLLESWYQETLSCIRNKASMITRRSAGLPSLITGILVASPEGALFERVMQDLIAEAIAEGRDTTTDGSHLPQVHALNCLKDIFIHTKLGQASEAYMAEGLSLAASRLESKVWAIRNCGLMLFRALIDRLLGSGTTQVWKESDRLKVSRLSYENYPSLLPIITRLLTPSRRGSFTNDVALEGVFPALQILQRALPPATRRAEIRQLVLNLVRSSHWHVRDMASRTLAALIDQTESLEWILHLLEAQFSGQNDLHGRLLSVKYMAKKHFENSCDFIGTAPRFSSFQGITLTLVADWHVIHTALLDKYENLFVFNNCDITKSAYLDIHNFLGAQAIGKHILFDTVNLRPSLDIGHFTTSGPSNEHASNSLNLLDNDQPRNLKAKSSGASLLYRAIALYQVLLELGPINTLDCDTTSITLEKLSPLLSTTITSTPVDFQRLVMQSLMKLEGHLDDVQVASAARQTMANLLEAGVPASVLVEQQPTSVEEQLTKSKNGESSPSLNENTLRLRGPLLDLQFQPDSTLNPSLITSIRKFTRQLNRALNEGNPFPTRFAAVSSLASLSHIWNHPQRRSNPTFAAAILGLSLVTYDALNDDDDEIRDIAAKVVPKIIGGERFPPGAKTVVPLVASSMLAEHLADVFGGDEELCKQCIERMLCSESGRLLDGAPTALNTPVGDFLVEARKESTALFVQEKQNLFIDPVREAAVWSAALKRMKVEAVSEISKTRVAKWVIEGLDVLRKTAENERDGALGWTTKAEAFALGMRVIEAAGVALYWGEGNKEVKRLLSDLRDCGEKSGMNGLWLDKIGEIMVVVKEGV
ncbi:hypothetical protein K490DRAFT_46993 [Saccharata proteae CBS 121410]|uniref:DUF2428 domain-containing protein n=1 Tax=Saccharata proteae CBS 121410 TaxID=1314787 RepID=A0A9P4LVF1_9PEZI|nr:hypothetical protein K490DRAFT_46993 [Saccharata proteae CBS 121410]